MNIFKLIKEAVSVKDAASFYGLNPTKNNLCRCPFHNDRHPSMKVDERFYCFACGAKGDVIDFVSRLFHLNAKETADNIMQDFHLTYHASPPTYDKPTAFVKSKLLKYKEPGKMILLWLLTAWLPCTINPWKPYASMHRITQVKT